MSLPAAGTAAAFDALDGAALRPGAEALLRELTAGAVDIERYTSGSPAWWLLHYYSNLPAWMKRLPQPARPTLDALADRWFGVAGDPRDRVPGRR